MRMDGLGQVPGDAVLSRWVSAAVAFEGWESIAEARRLAASFLDGLRTVHGLTVSEWVSETVQLVVSELVTNTRKYAPGPCLLTLEVVEGGIEVSVWDSSPTPPTIMPPDPFRVGQHGLEIIARAARSVRISREPVGKRITAVVALDDGTR
ncbi:ATP-binding protein [Streptomyces sp. NPDC056387]|uniref:ATP-binding protein n=1 Tax=Streptomyces sp. NPDC056387 TaxID=3345803 RepID=UPI0035DEDEFD